jgi:hypothetical protein
MQENFRFAPGRQKLPITHGLILAPPGRRGKADGIQATASVRDNRMH